MLSPAALLAAILALWRIGADLKFTGPFAISSGFFAHWQVWAAIAACLRTAAVVAGRYRDHPGRVTDVDQGKNGAPAEMLVSEQ